MSAALDLAEAPAGAGAVAPAEADLGFRFDNTYTRLPERFFARIAPSPVRAPRVIRVNQALAETLGLDAAALAGPEGAAVLAGNRVPDGAAFVAQAYAGHQFGGFSPQLGDGRAVLLGEVIGRDGARRDIQLKGSGPTPFSRRGDGRAALGPVLREYILSEAMHALGVPTTRALAAVTTGESVMRETVLPGGVFTRVAASHIRVGTFQYFAARNDVEAVRTLADYAIARHYPDASGAAHPYRALLEGVVSRQAALVARWLLLGFIHGVMNTDNTSISGETIDYGPCAFMEAYEPATVFSSIDVYGRYAYGNQAKIMHWNLTRLAEALLPLLGDAEGEAIEAAQAALALFGPRFEAAYHSGLRAKIGLPGAPADGDLALCEELLTAMAANGADFTLTFRRLAEAARAPEWDAVVRTLFADPAAYDAWAARWRERLARDGQPPAAIAALIEAVNPTYIPRNHLVEAALGASVERADFAPFETLLDAIERPFDERPGLERFMLSAAPGERVLQTFCGT